MYRYVFCVCATLLGGAGGLHAQESKEFSCGHQADIVAAIQQARLEGIAESAAEAHVLAASPTWPDAFNPAVPLVVPWVYSVPLSDLEDSDLGEIWQASCLAQ